MEARGHLKEVGSLLLLCVWCGHRTQVVRIALKGLTSGPTVLCTLLLKEKN